MEIIHIGEEDNDNITVTWLMTKDEFETLMAEAQEEVDNAGSEDKE